MRLVYILAVAVVAAPLIIGASLLISKPQAATEIDQDRLAEALEQLLRERPEIVVEALRAYQEQQEVAENERQQQQLSANMGQLFSNANDPFIGNPNGTVTLVEFFDYRCGYCKRVLEDVLVLTEQNDDLKVVFKEFPILGDASVIASRVSLALNLAAPEHYAEFHREVMHSRTTLDREALLDIAANLGADRGEVEALLEDPRVGETVRQNYELAEQLGIRGTPAFVIGDTIVPGAAHRDTLERLIEDQRG